MMDRFCSNCNWQDASDRGLCWCPNRMHPEDDGPVFSEVTSQTESENRFDLEVCEHWQFAE